MSEYDPARYAVGDTVFYRTYKDGEPIREKVTVTSRKYDGRGETCWLYGLSNGQKCWEPWLVESEPTYTQSELDAALALRAEAIIQHIPWSDGKCTCGFVYTNTESIDPFEDWRKHTRSLGTEAERKALEKKEAELKSCPKPK